MMRARTILIMLSLGALLTACSTPPNPPPVAGAAASPNADTGYQNISAPKLSTMLEAKDFFFVNTHVPDAGNIARTDASIPYDQTEALLKDYPSDRNARIVVYCSSGRMSAIAAQVLVQAGYTNVWNLEGGMSAWQQAGYALEQ